jgi:hypothetical protein
VNRLAWPLLSRAFGNVVAHCMLLYINNISNKHHLVLHPVCGLTFAVNMEQSRKRYRAIY